MAALDTVQAYVDGARVLLQDTVDSPYRYSDEQLAFALSLGLMEARRLRPDLFIGTSSVPSYTTVDATEVEFDQQYRVALLYYMVGHAQLRDEEDTQDARAAGLLQKFSQILLALG